LATTLTISVLAGGWFGLARRLRAAWAPNDDQRAAA
jgi:P-type Ca2+ transporter type 2C